MREGIHKAIQDQTFVPLFCISATSNIGVRRLCDFIAKYGSSPDDRKVVIANDEKGNNIEVSLDGDETVMTISEYGRVIFIPYLFWKRKNRYGLL